MPPPYQAGTSEHLQHLGESVFRILESVGKELPLTSAPTSYPPPPPHPSGRTFQENVLHAVLFLLMFYFFVLLLFLFCFVLASSSFTLHTQEAAKSRNDSVFGDGYSTLGRDSMTQPLRSVEDSIGDYEYDDDLKYVSDDAVLKKVTVYSFRHLVSFMSM